MVASVESGSICIGSDSGAAVITTGVGATTTADVEAVESTTRGSLVGKVVSDVISTISTS